MYSLWQVDLLTMAGLMAGLLWCYLLWLCLLWLCLLWQLHTHYGQFYYYVLAEATY